MTMHRGSAISSKEAQRRARILRQALGMIKKYMRSQHNKDVATGYIFSEIKELEAL
jgi:hypothetical protein